MTAVVEDQALLGVDGVHEIRPETDGKPDDAHEVAPVKWSRVSDGKSFPLAVQRLRFWPDGSNPASSTTLRGHLGGVVGLPVGFGSNFMNAIYAEQRLISTTAVIVPLPSARWGSRTCLHREHVASRDELEVVASSSVRRNPDLYLKHVRPPMLKDYFNPQLRMVTPVHRRLRQVTVRFEVEEDFVPTL